MFSGRPAPRDAASPLGGGGARRSCSLLWKPRASAAGEPVPRQAQGPPPHQVSFGWRPLSGRGVLGWEGGPFFAGAPRQAARPAGPETDGFLRAAAPVSPGAFWHPRDGASGGGSHLGAPARARAVCVYVSRTGRRCWQDCLSGLLRRVGSGRLEFISISAQPCCQGCPRELRGCELLIHSALHSVPVEYRLRARLCEGGQHAGPGLLEVWLSSSRFNHFPGVFFLPSKLQLCTHLASGLHHGQLGSRSPWDREVKR